MTQENKVIAGIAVLTTIIIAVSIFFLGESDNNQSAAKNVSADPLVLVRSDSFKVVSESAKVTLVEFSDFQCPACAQVQLDIGKILTEYQGKINFVFRHFPLPQHNNAIVAAVAVEAAGRQGQFLPMGAKLFASQSDWEESSNPGEIFTSYAGQLGMDTGKFQQDLKDQDLLDKIKRDYQDAVTLKINATPTFFVDGEQVQNSSYVTIKDKLDTALSK